ncbi:hypothetical protein ES705_16626 [subsurface metagenome]
MLGAARSNLLSGKADNNNMSHEDIVAYNL